MRRRCGDNDNDTGQECAGENGKLSLAEILELMAAGDLPLRFSAYDGSTAEPRTPNWGSTC